MSELAPTSPWQKHPAWANFLHNPCLFIVAIGSLCLAACGRPASEAECREILRKSAELELSERLGSREMISAEVDAIEEEMEAKMMEKCVGKRITDGTIACIRQAQAADQLFKDCF